jgi:hypothetical protein
MAVNKGRKYEILTQQVIKQLLAQDKILTDVKHDVVIQGKTTRHQIDVYFEMVIGRTTYKSVVQCKNLKGRVCKSQILTFKSVLDDIPGQPRGIFVTRSKLQRGALDYARKLGITLYELREVADNDWDGLIRTVVINATIFSPRRENMQFVFDQARISEKVAAIGPRNEEFKISKPLRDVVCQTATGERIDLEDAIRKTSQLFAEGLYELSYRFENCAYINIDNCPINPIPVLGLRWKETIHCIQMTQTCNIDHLIAYSFSDVFQKTLTFLGPNGESVRNHGLRAEDRMLKQ